MAGENQDEVRRAAIATGQNLERRGLLDGALQAYLGGGALEDAARVLIAQRRFSDAGKVLMRALGVPAEQVGTLDPARRKLAFQAAVCFSRAGDAALAAALFMALGERARAEEVLRKSGDNLGANRVLSGGSLTARNDPSANDLQAARNLERQGRNDLALESYLRLNMLHDAARMAASLGRFAEAAELFLNANLPFEAAECFERAGDGIRALDAIQLVNKDDPRYRAACVRAIRVATGMERLDLRLDHFIAPFLATAPVNESEAVSFYDIAHLYEANDHLSAAEEAYRKVLSLFPTYRDAGPRLERVRAMMRGSARDMERVLKEEQAFRAATRLPDLPDLPDLPSLPDMPLPGTPGPRRASNSSPPTTAASPDDTLASDRKSPSKPPAPTSHSGPALTVPVEQGRSIEQIVAVGNVVAGRYRIEKKIGQGGMAAVFRALDLELNERLALKIFTQRLDDEQMVGRFKQELSLSRQLLHPNIIHLFDMGSEQGFRFITMELLSGGDLRSKLGKPLPAPQGIDYLRQVCLALQHAHSKGIVHRDVKPANIFLTQDNVIKLMDFGIAKRQSTPGLTVAGMIAGTPEYMSPEQIQGFERVTASTDLYAVGVMAYEFFVGSVPFRHPELMPLLLMHMNDKPPDPRIKNPAISPALAGLILRLLEKDPARRYANCQEVISALSAIGPG